MKKLWKRDLALIPMAVGPFILLKIAWNDIPNNIIINWMNNTFHESKYVLFYACLLPMLGYLLLVFPAILPFPGLQKSLLKRRNKYFSIKCGVLLFLLLLDLLIFWHFQYNNMPPILPGY
ncbi:MAG: hypothetical protein ACRDE2_02910 [Chitinophagaceae bacterium]